MPYIPFNGPGHRDDVSGDWIVPVYDPDTGHGRGIGTTWDDPGTASGIPANQGGMYCSLCMNHPSHGPVKGSPIPMLDYGTHVLVNYPAKGLSVITELIDLGPALHTGAPIDLTADVKKVFGVGAHQNILVEFDVLTAHKPASIWLDQIIKFKQAGYHDVVRNALDQFRRLFPAVQVPADLIN